MIGRAIYTILSGDAAVSALVSTRIYPMRASQATPNPCIIYNLDMAYEDNKDNVANVVNIEAQIDIYTDYNNEGNSGEGYGSAEDLADKVITALDRVSGTYNGIKIDKFRLIRRDDFYDDQSEAYRTLLEFDVRVQQ